MSISIYIIYIYIYLSIYLFWFHELSISHHPMSFFIVSRSSPAPSARPTGRDRRSRGRSGCNGGAAAPGCRPPVVGRWRLNMAQHGQTREKWEVLWHDGLIIWPHQALNHPHVSYCKSKNTYKPYILPLTSWEGTWFREKGHGEHGIFSIVLGKLSYNSVNLNLAAIKGDDFP